MFDGEKLRHSYDFDGDKRLIQVQTPMPDI